MIKAFLLGYSPSGSSAVIDVVLRDSSHTYDLAITVPMSISISDTPATIAAAAPGVVVSYLGGLGVTVNSTEWEISTTPVVIQAAIADATAGAVTNLGTSYNLATGLLGIANALNDANSAQNDLATKFNAGIAKLNTLLAELRTLGLITP